MELISIAAALGCQHVCLFTHVAPEALDLFPCNWDIETRRAVKKRCEETGVSANSLEYFDVFPGIDLDSYRKSLEIGAELGARCATTHVHAEDLAWAIDNFARFCEITAEFGISASIEFTRLCGVATLRESIEIVKGANMGNGGIALDTLHWFRSGADVDDLIRLDRALVKSVQISDGPLDIPPGDAYGIETVFERRIPGEGEFPLRELAQYFPPGMVVDVEVPLQSYRQRGVGALERARLAVDGARRVLSPMSLTTA